FKELGLDLGNHVLYDAFGGVFDLSETTELSWINRKMVKMAAKDDPNIELNKRNDLRDWDQINKFIDSFASRIK
ncbi:MAG: hypothetical protein ACXAEL_12305, partial [Candidatus Hodarchaeales archaeon]